MLRITIQSEVSTMRFILEGRLAGPWVDEVRSCWAAAESLGTRRLIMVDLSEVGFIDQAGKELLAWMHQRGTQFVAEGLMTKAVIEEVTQAEPETERQRV